MSEDDPEDPFEQLDVPDDREGDPFEELDGPAEGDAERPTDPPDPVADVTADTDTGQDEATSPDDQPPTDPVSAVDTASTVDPPQSGERDSDPFSEMGERGGDPFDDAESVFESVDVGSVDPDEVWESLGEDEAATSHSGGKRYAEVSKHRYCEQCEHFSGPPEVRCTHEDTEILEFLDMETVRLLNCPVVAEQRALGNEE
ncbi:hypothetical protein EGH21_12760 [Halomicroarcula sp. F13]|uniref:DUF8135 domain-containing protein n=1 Tax=Haloarcula rubra TaxID=2487747 RepID=A0AAW4PUF8_9EURY|nr:hypothetical protein [Halomicroarcula rubra]MBX0323902.1 hypothetical protein [Halomicroarcula rubra]